MQGPGTTTVQLTDSDSEAERAEPVPGVVVIFANQRARSRVFRWEGAALELGRLELAEDDVLDSAISRKHVGLRFEDSAWRLEDFGSRNKTFVAGLPLTSPRVVEDGSPIRVGGALLLALRDVLGFQRYGLGVRDGVVGGPSLRRALETVALSRKADLLTSVLISAESGAGKEVAAQVFHHAGPNGNAPFVPVNCATIPKDLAERLLFGSRRGAFSGALDASGYVQAADGGTLFLDEIAELAPEVQTKLLRLLESREVTRLGATSSERVDIRICAATWRDLRQEVAAGRFREDLYFRIGQPEIRLPPLRERIEEIPWHVQSVLEAPGAPRGIEVSSAFIEACALRAWPGNVRELRSEVRRCLAAASARGAKSLTAEALAPTAGVRIVREESTAAPPSFPADEVASALFAEAGNVVGAARRLGIHRNKIRRWLERHAVDVRHFKG